MSEGTHGVDEVRYISGVLATLLEAAQDSCDDRDVVTLRLHKRPGQTIRR